MQTNPKRGKAAFRTRSVNLSIAILASAPLIAAVSLWAPDRALAACGGSSRPAGVHAVGSGAAGVHVASTTVARSSGGSGGGGALGCAGGSSASALHGLPVASSGRVVETGALESSGYSSLLRETLANLPEGTWEYVCHPGYSDADLRAVRTRLLDSRDEERKLLTSPELRQFLEEQKIRVISYRDFIDERS